MFAIFLFLAYSNVEGVTKQNEDFFQFENNSLDISILKSKNEKFLIYRNTGKKECYIERVTIKNSEDEQNSRTLYVGQEPLKKSDKVYTELDDETKNFCNQFSLYVLQEEPPMYITKGKHVRKRRGAPVTKQSRYRTQTQSQYISFDGGRGNNTPTQLTFDPGNSRLVVSGNIRLEQSQSQYGSTDCSESNSWPQAPQPNQSPKYPTPPAGQSYIPSSQQQTGSQPQNVVPASPPSAVSPSGIPGQQIIPSPGTGYIPGSLPSGNIYPQPPTYYIPSSPSQQTVPQTPQYLPANTQHQPGTANIPTNFQVPATGFQPTNPSVQTGPLSPPHLPPNNQANAGSTNFPRPQYIVPGSQQQNSGGSTTGSQNGQYIPVNALPAGQYNPGTANNLTHTPPYYVVLLPSQQQSQAPQYILINTQTVYPQNSHHIITNSERPYFTPTVQQGQFSPQIAPNGQFVPLPGSYPHGYVPPSNQNTQQPNYPGGIINPQSQPSPNPSSQVVSQPVSGGAANLPTGSTNSQPTNNPIVPNGQIVPSPGTYPQGYVPPSNQNTHQQNYPGGVTNPQTQPSPNPSSQVVPQPVSGGAANLPTGSTNSQPTDNVPQSSQIPQHGGVITQPQISSNTRPGGFIYCQSCSYVPVTPQHTGGVATNPLPSSYPTYQQGSGLVPAVPQNSGLQPQTPPYRFPAVSHPTSAVDNQHSISSQTGLVVDPNNPFQTQYIPPINVPYQQPQVIPSETQVYQPGTSEYVPGSNPNPYYPQAISASKNYTNVDPTINVPTIIQNGSSIGAVEDEIIEEALSVSSINIVDNATRAEAKSEGKNKNGIVRAEVSGTYTKDFAAKAQTIDKDRSAISQIFGNGTGAISTSYGRSGKSESQSQVIFSHETGSAVAESRGGGAGYNLAGQIRAGIRGGQSDSLASGPGNTFSQAQIGFVPTFEENFLQRSIFQGGGTASSNMTRHSGFTDLQFQGQFQSGPPFTGRVQAGAGKVSPSQTQIAFNSTNLTDLSRKDNIPTSKVDKAAEMTIEDETESEGNNATPLKLILPQPSTHNSLDTLSDFGPQNSNPQKRLLRGESSKHKSQNGKQNAINKGDPSSNKFLSAGEIIPGTKTKVPAGFRGRLIPQDVHPSDIQTSVTNSGRTTEIDYRGPSKQGKVYIQKGNFENQQHLDGYDGFMTVTKSETGELQNKSRNYDHTYYTKSSTCGFFTYTCNLIDGPDGRTKICKQNPPTDVNGSPC